MPDRIRTDESRAAFLRRICGKDGQDDGVFTSYYQALTFAAGLGHRLGTPTPIANPAKEPDGVRIDIFQNNKLDYVIDLLALAEDKDPRVLGDDTDHIDRRCQLFEGYANTGLRWLEQHCTDGSSPLDAILAAIARFRPVPAEGISPPSLASLLD